MFKLPDLPYAYDALDPYIHADIQALHHDKHHQTYVDNLNKILADYPEWNEKRAQTDPGAVNKLLASAIEKRRAFKPAGGKAAR